MAKRTWVPKAYAEKPEEWWDHVQSCSACSQHFEPPEYRLRPTFSAEVQVGVVAAYVTAPCRPGREVRHTEDLGHGVIVDLDDDGEVLGVEVLFAAAKEDS